jgi:hypothetical protein
MRKLKKIIHCRVQEIVTKLNNSMSDTLHEELRKKLVDISQLHLELEKLTPATKQLSCKDLMKEWSILGEGLGGWYIQFS